MIYIASAELNVSSLEKMWFILAWFKKLKYSKHLLSSSLHI